MVVEDGLRTYLPTDAQPGARLIVPLLVRTPKEPGSLVLVVSLVQEQVAWFVDKNPTSACHLPIVVGGVSPLLANTCRKGRARPFRRLQLWLRGSHR